MRDVPAGWVVASLRDLVSLKTGPFGSSLHESDYVADGIPIINPMHIEGGRISPSSKHRVSSETAQRLHEFKVQLNDIVIGRRGEMGRCAVVKQRETGWLCGTGSLVIRSASGLCADFLQRYLSSDAVVKYLLQASVGSTMANLNQDVLMAITVGLPPTQEQTRIVDKLEELLSDLDAGVAELKAAQKKLAQYRQSLLKAAVEGRLTEAWRAQQGEPEESGSQLLARILRERRARWEAKQLAKFEAQGKAPTKGWQTKYPEPSTADLSMLPSLPRGWVWASADQLTTECSYGTSVKCSYESNGVPVLRIPNVARRELDLDDLKFANEPLHLAATDYLASGDILVVRTNGSIGLVGRAAAIDTPLDGDFYFASYLLRLRAVERTVGASWISAFLGSSSGRGWIEKRAASSAGQHNISLSTLLTLPIPLPPIAEQHEVIASLRSALDVAGVRESDTATSLRQAAAQRKNILQAAFSGQLVPQDPNDEPASVLLERIRAQRAAKGTTSKPRAAEASA